MATGKYPIFWWLVLAVLVLAVPMMGAAPCTVEGGGCNVTADACGPVWWSAESMLFYPGWSELFIESGFCSRSGEEVYHSFSVYCPDGDFAPCLARDFAATSCPDCYTLARVRSVVPVQCPRGRLAQLDGGPDLDGLPDRARAVLGHF